MVKVFVSFFRLSMFRVLTVNRTSPVLRAARCSLLESRRLSTPAMNHPCEATTQYPLREWATQNRDQSDEAYGICHEPGSEQQGAAY